MSSLTIEEFFAGKTILITGVTGFVGGVLLERLLRFAPRVEKIIVLMRPKSDEAAEKRLNDIFSSQLFEPLKNERTEDGENIDFEKLIQKVTIVKMDLMRLSEARLSDLQMIRKEVNIIWHLAATQSYTEPLHIAIRMNIVAVLDLHKLAATCERLEAFVHLSTAFSNSAELERIEERFYPEHSVDPYTLMLMESTLSREYLQRLQNTALGKRANTYIFTKQSCEELLRREERKFPLVIIRPTVIGPAIAQPIEGWIKHGQQSTQLQAAVFRGAIRVILADETKQFNNIPVDIVCNQILCITFHAAITKPTKPIIYNVTQHKDNTLTFDRYLQGIRHHLRNYLPDNPIRRPRVRITKHQLIHSALTQENRPYLFFHDLLNRIRGKPTNVLNESRDLALATKPFPYFMFRRWRWTNHNFSRVKALLNEDDVSRFQPALEAISIDWPIYFESYMRGVKQFVLLEDPNSARKSHFNYLRLTCQRFAFNAALTYLLYRLVLTRSHRFNDWMSTIGQLLTSIIRK